MDNNFSTVNDTHGSNESLNNSFNGEPSDNRQSQYNNKKAGTSGLGIAALILSILGCTSLIGLILGIVDVTRKDNKKKGISVAAIVIGGVWIIISLFMVLIIGLSDPDTALTTEETTQAQTVETIDTSESNDEEGDVSNDNDEEGKASDDDKDESVTLDPEGYKSICEIVDYEAVQRNPNKYENINIVVEGEVVQVQESESFFSNGTAVVMRVAEDGDYDKMWYVEYKRTEESESRILEDDYITIYGVCDGVTSYTAVLGDQIIIPAISAEYIVDGKVDDNDNVVKFNADEIAENLNITEYTYDSYFNGYYFLSIENTSEYTLDIDASIKYYDENDNLIGADSSSIYALAKGEKGLAVLFLDSSFSRIEYEITPSIAKYYKPANDDISYDVSETSEKIIVTVTNNSDSAIDDVEGYALFFKNGEVVGYSDAYFYDSDYELKAGKSITEEMDCYDVFDSYELFISAMRS